jgi:hypothetical protein
MAGTFDPTDPRNLTPEQRLDELAAILATGGRRVLALRARAAIAAADGTGGTLVQIPSESCQIPLEVSSQSRLHGINVVNTTREPQRRCT